MAAPPAQAAQGPPSQALGTSRDERPQLWTAVPGPHCLLHKEFLTSELNFSRFTLKPFSLVHIKSQSSSCLLPSSTGRLQWGLPGALSSSGWTKSSFLSPSSEERWSSPLSIFMASSGPVSTAPHFSDAGGPSTEHCTPSGSAALVRWRHQSVGQMVQFHHLLSLLPNWNSSPCSKMSTHHFAS